MTDIIKEENKCKGWLGSTAIALGGANLSIFILGTLISGQGTSFILLLMVGLLISLIAAPGYLELTLMYPHKVGGITAVCGEAFRPYNPILANLAGTCYWFAWVPAASFAAIFTAEAIHQFFMPGVSVNWLSTGLIIAVAAVNFSGLARTQRLAIPIAALAATLALLSSVIPVFTGHVHWAEALNYQLKTPFQGWFGQVTSFMAGLYLIGWVAPAFESVLCFIGEMQNPQKNAPRAMWAAIIFSVLYFSLFPLIWLGTLGVDSLGKDLLGQELWVAYAPFLGPLAKSAAAWFIIFNMLICIFTPLAGPPRTLAQLANEGLLPSVLGLKTRLSVPWVALLLTAAVAILIIWVGAPIWLMAATNFDYLLCISLASIAVWVLRQNAPEMPRAYRAPKRFIELGLAAAFVWMFSAILGFQQFGLSTMIVGIAFSFTGALFYFYRRAVERRKEGLPLTPKSLHVKLTGTMISVLLIDALGYFIAVNSVDKQNHQLIASLEDIFVVVALLTLSVGLVLPGMIVHAAEEVNKAAKRLIKGTLFDFSNAMQALATGNLKDAYAQTDITLISIHSHDEIGEMAASFNKMQEEIKRSAENLSGAREGLLAARKKLMKSNLALKELNETLEQRVHERTSALEATNAQLTNEINDRIKAESKAALLNSQLVVAARKAGMADIATSVLHNIGNVLNSINVSTGVIHQKLTNSEIAHLGKLIEIFREHEADFAALFNNNPKGGQLMRYLFLLAESWEADEKAIVAETKALEKNVQHIKEIVVTQQSFSKASLMTEEVSIAEIIEDALKLNQKETMEIEIDRHIAPLRRVMTDKIKLLQILVNLIKNSIDSVTESHTHHPTIDVEVKEKDADTFEIRVTDNGLGIAPENITKIFSHGFTTKKTGHGFGLHTSALFAVEMGGSLLAESEGQGKGAVFILTLPYEPSTNKAPSAGSSVEHEAQGH